MKKTFYLLLLLAIALVVSCTKEGMGGKATIKGMAMHHSQMVSGATVYIKYNATELPGTNVTYYDDHVSSDANADFQFSDLKKGDYYLFAVGFDSTISQQVSGGVHVEIKKKTETMTISIPVTE